MVTYSPCLRPIGDLASKVFIFYSLLFCTQPDRNACILSQALKWHPDKNRDDPKKAEGRFKIVSEAYEVRANYTRRNEESSVQLLARVQLERMYALRYFCAE